MAFAIKLLEKTQELNKCTELDDSKYKEQRLKLTDLIAPPVSAIVIGTGEKAVTIGGEEVMYRHELTYYHPTAIAILVDADAPEAELLNRVKAIQDFQIIRVGQSLTLDCIAVRCVSGDAGKFSNAVSLIVKHAKMPLILCSLNPNVLEAGLAVAKDVRPLIYAATKDNWKQVGELALKYNCPVAIFAQNDLKLLRSIANTFIKMGVSHIALDPGTSPEAGLDDTINNFTMLRRSAIEKGDKLLGFPIVGVPATVWIKPEATPELTKWKETCLASMLLARYANLLIMYTLDTWTLLPLLTLRQNIYTDPRKPVAVDPGLREFGKPDAQAPVMFTSNFSLTYYTVASDIESAKIDCYLLVVDTEGLSVQTSVAGKKLTPDKVAEIIKKTGIESKVKHRKLVIPGYAARLRGDLEDLTGWQVLVGPIDSSGIPKFLNEKWR
jgi:acetyl-CoA decarbonylase/synthase complex subunit gamma